MLLYVHRDYVRTIRDGEPRTASSTFTQLLSSVILEEKKTADRSMGAPSAETVVPPPPPDLLFPRLTPPRTDSV